MSVQREIARVIANQTKKDVVPSISNYAFAKKRSMLSPKSIFDKILFPVWFKLFRAPYDRYRMAELSHWLRIHGIMYDDWHAEDREPIVERALELMPEDMLTSRYRRMWRGAHMEYLRLYLPIDQQNYDPFIPYLAPFIEEAKFQLQEEEELLGYHPYDRRIGYCGTTGFGDIAHGAQHAMQMGC